MGWFHFYYPQTQGNMSKLRESAFLPVAETKQSHQLQQFPKYVNYDAIAIEYGSTVEVISQYRSVVDKLQPRFTEATTVEPLLL